jgi:hypothetical protein
LIRCSSSGGSSSSSISSGSSRGCSTSDDDFYQFLHQREPKRAVSAQKSSMEDGVLTSASLASAATSAIGVEATRQDDGQDDLFGPGCQDAKSQSSEYYSSESLAFDVDLGLSSPVLDGARKRKEIRRRSSLCNGGSAGFMIATVDNTPVISFASTTRPSLQLPSWLKRPPAPAPVRSHSIFL